MAGPVCLGCPASLFCGFSHLVLPSLSPLYIHNQVFHSDPSGQPDFAAAASLIGIKSVGDWAPADGAGLWESHRSDPFLYQGPRPQTGLLPSFAPTFRSRLCQSLTPARPGRIGMESPSCAEARAGVG